MEGTASPADQHALSIVEFVSNLMGGSAVRPEPPAASVGGVVSPYLRNPVFLSPDHHRCRR